MWSGCPCVSTMPSSASQPHASSARASTGRYAGCPSPGSSSRRRRPLPTRYVFVPGPVKGLGFWPSATVTRGDQTSTSGRRRPIITGGAATLLPGHGHARDPERGRRDRAEPLHLAADGVDPAQHLVETPGDRHLVDGACDAAVLDPEAGGAAREVARHRVEAVPEQPGDEEPALGGESLAVEGGAREPAGAPPAVDAGHEVARYPLAEALGEVRRAPVERAARDAR